MQKKLWRQHMNKFPSNYLFIFTRRSLLILIQFTRTTCVDCRIMCAELKVSVSVMPLGGIFALFLKCSCNQLTRGQAEGYFLSQLMLDSFLFEAKLPPWIITITNYEFLKKCFVWQHWVYSAGILGSHAAVVFHCCYGVLGLHLLAAAAADASAK